MTNLTDDINKQTKKAAKKTERKSRYTRSRGNEEAKQDVGINPNLHFHAHTSSPPLLPSFWKQMPAHAGIMTANISQLLLTVTRESLSYRAGCYVGLSLVSY